ncbi:MAG: pantetheine-phosphate adenylyltransferase [Bifidobacteriaceae bacterium]|jgi:pantetheine-phosphate adenylyltransferase|nr:pantetheine-phosphate adenylyltransferase [Bifidobacteriaceae bacterium]
MTRAVYPGSFDPVTLGHIDVIKRSSKLFDEVIVLVAENSSKKSWFTASERVKLIQHALGGQVNNVTVDSTDGLVAKYCQTNQANIIIRSLRHGGDYDAEISMALINRKLGEVETIFLPASQDQEHISSSIVKEVAIHDGNLSKLVPKFIANAIEKRVQNYRAPK